jgi:hypothetical protein
VYHSNATKESRNLSLLADTAKKTDDDEVLLPMPNSTTAGLTVDLKTKYSTIYNVFKSKE